MRNFGSVGDRFLSDMRTLAGGAFRGTIMPATDQEGSSFDFSTPRLVLRVRQDAIVRTRDVITTQSGERYIVADHYAGEPGWRSHRLFRAEKLMSWKRPVSGLDVVTGLPKAGGTPTDKGQIWVTTEMARRQFSDPGLKIPIERLVIVTGSEVLANDTLDGKSVTRVNVELGLSVLEIH